MSHNAPPKPVIKAARVELKPSEWSPRSIPVDAPGRSTEDPRTPKLSELQARTQPASLLTVAPAGSGGSASRLADRPPLRPAQCGGAWRDVTQRADRVLAQGRDPRTGRVDLLERNRAVTAAYADLNRANPDLRWAGVAAFASKQVGCGIQDARQVAADTSVAERMPGPAGTGARATMEGRRAAARHMEAALGRGNEAVFRDIYPPHLFYNEHGIEGLRTCADARPGGAVPAQVLAGFEQISQGGDARLRAGAQDILRYEQQVTLQEAVYSDPVTVGLLVGNQAAVKAGEATRRIGGERAARAAGARPVEVAFTAECDGTPSERFTEWNLADFDQRWPYAQRVANRFHTMVEGRGASQIQQALGTLSGRGR